MRKYSSRLTMMFLHSTDVLALQPIHREWASQKILLSENSQRSLYRRNMFQVCATYVRQK